MAAPDMPNRFSHIAHQLVHAEKRESIFFVKMVRVPHCHAKIVEHLQNKFHMKPSEAEGTIKEPFFATGSMIYQDENFGYILTCAHILEDFYSANIVLSKEQANRWFKFLILCKHNEDHMKTIHPDLYESERDKRNYTVATVLKIDQRKDLMLLQFNLSTLYATQYAQRCRLPHQSLKLAENPSSAPNDVVMISWPPNRPDTVVIGQVSNQCRLFNQLTTERDKGYNMQFIELKINVEKGASGSPILNHAGDILAVYHGRIEGKGYAISHDDIYEFLYTRKILSQNLR
ncbi:uncharacterized protein [Oryza sativa Japonica Group]|uniref:Expressed protein n=4 Tax=Oryza sativa TaxID=4530 RepID=Q75GW5_ORYSJ|nr:uncharacterized protein LOC4333637 [Oryza sativa Japonica Group]KAB8092890.1 hypothetical protein EE612_019451 [Oryza sativa]AAS07337.1 expressed protein [Oryza sativa Japonica Group]ABF98028.1 expressed protein [Oryza sativa Japonica Group]KAF2940531.1 hypothetical protein DAI22_03g278900 [Oryza sativa Japonica Group]BAF12743.1 Os03g0661900 [Oryza sativa Japonica Group]|eukprot:NP_001050829.1 Os03g0661900 [Oryza sativa Japonica Group]